MTGGLMTEPVLITDDAAVVLVGSGAVAAPALRRLAGLGPLVAADGGADRAAGLGLRPQLILGDMDSIADPDRFPDSRIVPMADQDSTDLEKALAAVRAPLVLGFGFLGRRFDHSLAALHALARARTGGAVLLVGKHDVVGFSRQKLDLQLAAGSRFSVWPLTEQRFVSSDGLVWPLDGLVLRPGSRVGTSNRVADAAAGQVAVRLIPADNSGYFVLTPPDGLDAMLAAARDGGFANI